MMRRRTYVSPIRRREHYTAALGAVVGMLALSLAFLAMWVCW